MTDKRPAESAAATIPVLALRGLTVFPQLTLHFDVGRAASIQALEEAMGEKREIFLDAAGPDGGESRSGRSIRHRHRSKCEADSASA